MQNLHFRKALATSNKKIAVKTKILCVLNYNSDLILNRYCEEQKCKRMN